MPPDVDYRVMGTFLQFYTTMLGFVNYKLYATLDLKYPPKVIQENLDNDLGLAEFMVQTTAGVLRLHSFRSLYSCTCIATAKPSPATYASCALRVEFAETEAEEKAVKAARRKVNKQKRQTASRVAQALQDIKSMKDNENDEETSDDEDDKAAQEAVEAEVADEPMMDTFPEQVCCQQLLCVCLTPVLGRLWIAASLSLRNRA